MSNVSIRRVKTTDLDLKDRLVSIQRVTKVTKGGRTFSFQLGESFQNNHEAQKTDMMQEPENQELP